MITVLAKRSAESPQTVIGTTVSHYRIIDKLGAGGMGEVFVAEDLILHRMVAIKFAAREGSGGLEDRLLEEARSASALDHPNIARIYDCGAAEGRLFVVMERVKGRTLAQIIHDGPIPLAKVLHIGGAVLAGLGAAHRAGIVHRDVKPSNVMVDEEGVVKVLDFGLAKRRPVRQLAASASSEVATMAMSTMAPLTGRGQVLGTPAYMSPEHVRGVNVDARGDVFAVGSLLYACVTGHSPFRGQTTAEVMGQVMHVTPHLASSSASGVPAEFDRIVMKALEKDPANRYQTAEEMRLELARLGDNMSGSGGLALMAVPVAPIQARLLRRKWMVGVGAGTAAIAGVGVWRFAGLGSVGPSPEALRWYELGVGALRDGTYFNATSALGRAVAADDGFALGHARLAEAWAELDSIERAQREMLLALRGPGRGGSEGLTIEAIQAVINRDFTGAIARYEALLKKASAAEKPQVWVDLGRVHEKANNMAKAIECYNGAARNSQYGAAFLRRGVVYGQQGKMELSEKDLAQAQAIYDAGRNLEGVAEVHFQRGRRLTIRGTLGPARESLEKSLKLATDFGSEYQQLRAQMQLSMVTYSEGNGAGAQEMAQGAVRRARQLRLPYLTIRGLNDLGSAQLVKGDLAAAEATLREALELATADKQLRGQATAQLSLGSALVQARRFDDAELQLKSALSFFTRGQFEDESAKCQTLLMRVYRSRGEFEEVHRILAEQLRLAEGGKNPGKISSVLGEIANVYSFQERYPDALKAFEHRYEIAKDRGVLIDIGYSLSGQISMLAQLGEPVRARSLFDELRKRMAGSDLMSKRLKWLDVDLLYCAGAWSATAAAAAVQLAELGLVLDKELELRGLRVCSLARSGRNAEALSELATLTEQSQQSQDMDRREGLKLVSAEVYLLTKNGARARELAQTAIQYFETRQQLDSWYRAETLVGAAALQQHDTSRGAQSRASVANILSRINSTWGVEWAKKYSAAPQQALLRKYLA